MGTKRTEADALVHRCRPLVSAPSPICQRLQRPQQGHRCWSPPRARPLLRTAARPPAQVADARSTAPPRRSEAVGTDRQRALGRSSAPPRGHRSRSPRRARPLLHAPARPPAQGSSARSCWGSRPGRRREQRLAAAEARAEKNLAGEGIRKEERRGGARERGRGGRCGEFGSTCVGYKACPPHVH